MILARETVTTLSAWDRYLFRLATAAMKMGCLILGAVLHQHHRSSGNDPGARSGGGRAAIAGFCGAGGTRRFEPQPGHPLDQRSLPPGRCGPGDSCWHDWRSGGAGGDGVSHCPTTTFASPRRSWCCWPCCGGCPSCPVVAFELIPNRPWDVFPFVEMSTVHR
jgi:hypothetical protein